MGYIYLIMQLESCRKLLEIFFSLYLYITLYWYSHPSDSKLLSPHLSKTGRLVWILIHPFQTFLANVCAVFRFSVRQPYYIASGVQDFDDFRCHLAFAGYKDVKLAWKDGLEVLSMRRIVNRDIQHHVRLFYDGKVYGHLEYTPEHHPFKHLVGFNMIHSLELIDLVRSYIQWQKTA